MSFGVTHTASAIRAPLTTQSSAVSHVLSLPSALAMKNHPSPKAKFAAPKFPPGTSGSPNDPYRLLGTNGASNDVITVNRNEASASSDRFVQRLATNPTGAISMICSSRNVSSLTVSQPAILLTTIAAIIPLLIRFICLFVFLDGRTPRCALFGGRMPHQYLSISTSNTYRKTFAPKRRINFIDSHRRNSSHTPSTH